MDEIQQVNLEEKQFDLQVKMKTFAVFDKIPNAMNVSPSNICDKLLQVGK